MPCWQAKTPELLHFTGEDAEADPLSSGWRGFGTANGSSDSLAGTPPLLSVGHGGLRYENDSSNGRYTPDSGGLRCSQEGNGRCPTPEGNSGLPEQRWGLLIRIPLLLLRICMPHAPANPHACASAAQRISVLDMQPTALAGGPPFDHG